MGNLMGVIYTLILILGCMAAAYLVSRKSAETARKIVHIGVAHWYFIYVHCFTSPYPALAGLAAFALINGGLNLSGGLARLLGQKSTRRNWGLVWYPISFFVMVVLCAFGIGDRVALGCAMLGMGWGDGLAALLGSRFGKRQLYGGKTRLGFCVMFAVTGTIALSFTGSLPLALLCALTAAMLELITPFGLDNISVPLGIYAAAAILRTRCDVLDGLVFGLSCNLSLLALALIFAVLALAAYWLKLLTAPGAMAAFLMGMAVTAGLNWQGVTLLALFFVTSNILGTLCCRMQHTPDEVAEQKSGQRDQLQVAANGLAASVAAVAALLTGSETAVIVFGAALAEATADTWAGEIGRLSGRAPVSLLTGKPVPRGISGGVTVLGTAAGAAACVFIAVIWAIFRRGPGAPIVALCGFFGCLFDSLLGDRAQALYVTPDGSYTERSSSPDGTPYVLQRGRVWIDNDTVNLFSNAFSAFLALILAQFI